VFYVAASRAKDRLYIVWPAAEDEGAESHQASCFLRAVEGTPHVEFLQQMHVAGEAERITAAAAAAGARAPAAAAPTGARAP
jgi:ATP-dependent exoDNAse (exonuclease V) beta subunit